MLARPGGPKHNEEIYNIFVIIWAIYKSKRTKTPEDIEQIHITHNRVKNDKLLPLFLCTEIMLSFSRSLSQTHIQYRRAFAHTRGNAHRNLLSELPCEFINNIVL